VRPRAGVAVVAGGAVGLGRVRAHARRRVARPGVVALVGGGADDRIASRAGARLTGVRPRAGGAVVAGGAVGLGRVRAHAGRRVARPRVVALVGGRADDRVAPCAGTRPASVGLRADIAVVAEGAVGLGGVRAHAG